MPLPRKPSSSPPSSTAVCHPEGIGNDLADRPPAVDGAGPLGAAVGGSVLVVVGSAGTPEAACDVVEADVGDVCGRAGVVLGGSDGRDR